MALTNSSRGVTDTNSYDSFGNATNASSPSRYQFTGREYDATTGLQYSRGRWFDPNLGRFISEDPLGFRGGDANLYAYVWTSPGMYRDPTGLYPFKLPLNPGLNGSNLPEGWRHVDEHFDPTNPGKQRWVSPSGDEGLEFHPGRPDAPAGSEGAKDHSHKLNPKRWPPGRLEKDDEHLDPGQEVDLKECIGFDSPWRFPEIHFPTMPEKEIGSDVQ